jgi:hypothetical protein
MEAFRTHWASLDRSSLDRSLVGDKPAFRRPSPHRRFPFPARRRDWFDDWVVGRQFVPKCLHHPVVGLKLAQAYSHLLRQNGGFSHSLRVSGLVSAGDKSAFARPSLHRKFPFPPWGGDRFDDWLVGLQFEPDHLHHPVFRAQTSADLMALIAVEWGISRAWSVSRIGLF